jgi:hypothetical protein
MEEFKTGDLVRVRPGVHQEGMPDHRLGMIVESEGHDPRYLDQVYYILFLGTTKPIKFHNMFLEHFTST